jgi:hypothetical protein
MLPVGLNPMPDYPCLDVGGSKGCHFVGPPFIFRVTTKLSYLAFYECVSYLHGFQEQVSSARHRLWERFSVIDTVPFHWTKQQIVSSL